MPTQQIEAVGMTDWQRQRKNQQMRQWRLRNQERIREYARRYRQKNYDRRARYQRQWRTRNRKYLKEYYRHYNDVHREERKRSNDEYRKNPMVRARRRAASKSRRDRLTDGYIADKLGRPSASMSRELLQAKRAQIMLHRAIRGRK